MKRASFTAALILCGSLLVFWIFPALILPAILFGVLSGGVVLGFFLKKRSRILRDLLFSSVCILLSGIFSLAPITGFYSARETCPGRIERVTAVLTEDPVLWNGLYTYTARTALGEPFSQKFTFTSASRYGSAGDRISAEFLFSLPAKDRFLTDLSDGIVLEGELVSPEEEIYCSEGGFSFVSVSASVRRWVYKTLLRNVKGGEAGFMTAVLTGDKSVLSSDHYEVLQDTGMLHIVAVSGLHVSVFVSFVLLFLRKIRWLRLRLLLSLLSLGVILLFAGFTPSVCRAVIMNAVIFSADWFAVGTDPLNRLGIAGVGILLVSPWAAWSLSFQLSFLAALGIILLASPIHGTLVQWLFLRCSVICGSVLDSAVSLFAVSVASFSLTLPLLWIRMNSYSVWSLFLSPVVLPVLEACFSLCLVLLVFSLISGPPFLLLLLGRIVRYGVIYMTYLSSLAVSVMDVVDSVPDSLKWVVAGVCLVLAGLLFFLPSEKGSKRKKKQAVKRGTSLILLAIALLTAYQASESLSTGIFEGEVAPGKGVVQTAFLDVGQGNCFVSLFEDEACVVDCGGTKKAGLVAADYLTSAGFDTVKFVLISHLHDDHANGLSDLCEEKEIQEIIIPFTEGDAALYAEIVALAAEEGATLTVLEEDTQRTLGSATVRMLTAHLDPTSDDQNENSIVGLLEYGNYRALFTGDITSRAEKRLVEAYGNGLDCDVLSVPHHGSKSSSCDDFLKAVSPLYSVISVGEGNNYGHPTEEAMKRLSEVKSQIYRTDEDSTVTVRSDGEKMEVLPANEP